MQGTGSLKKELESVMPELKEMRKRKVERLNQFAEVVDKIYNISKELYISDKDYSDIKVIDESDLSLKRLDGLRSRLHDLEKEKVNASFDMHLGPGSWKGYLTHIYMYIFCFQGSFIRFSMYKCLKLKHMMV